MGSRPVGCGGPPVWLPCYFSFDSSSFRCSHSDPQLLPVFHQGDSSVHCSGRFAREGGHRASPSFAGLLQPPLCHSQGHRGLAACDRPLPSQPVRSSLPFSHGDSAVSPPVSSSGRLDGFFGSKGCLPSGPGSPGISLLPEVLCRRGGLAVSRALLRPFHRPAGVHACHGSDLVDNASSWVPDPEVSGRLASPRILVSGPGSGEGLPSLALSGARCPGQSGEEFPDSDSDLGLLGDAASDASFEGFPDPQTCPEAQLSACRIHLLSAAASVPVVSAPGVMSSLASIVLGARLLMRSFQLRMNSTGRLLADSDTVAWDSSCQEDLQWWSDDSHLLAGLPLGLSSPGLSLFTDASDTGWGASLRDNHLSGLWSPHCSAFSINHRELLAVLYGVQGFLPLLRLRSVSLFVDNTTALAYLRNQGGTHSSLLNSVAQEILLLCEAHRIRLVPQFIPGRMNVLADSLSHRSQVLGSEWTLCFPAFRDLLRLWPATIDLFATALNRRLPVYFSPMDDPQSAGTDAMMQPWDGLQAYAFPPFGLLHRVIAKVRQSRALELTLVAPFWPQHPWFPDLLELLVAVPVFLPRRKDLLRQPHFHCFHQNLPVLRLRFVYRALRSHLRLLFGSGSPACPLPPLLHPSELPGQVGSLSVLVCAARSLSFSPYGPEGGILSPLLASLSCFVLFFHCILPFHAQCCLSFRAS